MRDRVVVVVVGDHREHRPEDLLLRDRHRVVDVGEHRGLDVPARVEARRPAAADDELGRPPRCPWRCSPRPGRAGVARPAGRPSVVGSSGSPTFERADRRRRARRRPRRSASATRGCGSARRTPGRCSSSAAGIRPGIASAEVGVVEDDRRRLAAELERAALQLLAAQRRDPLAGRGRPGERDLVDVGVA